MGSGASRIADPRHRGQSVSTDDAVHPGAPLVGRLARANAVAVAVKHGTAEQKTSPASARVSKAAVGGKIRVWQRCIAVAL